MNAKRLPRLQRKRVMYVGHAIAKKGIFTKTAGGVGRSIHPKGHTQVLVQPLSSYATLSR